MAEVWSCQELLVAKPGIREHLPRSSPSHTARQILPHCKLTVLFKIMQVV